MNSDHSKLKLMSWNLLSVGESGDNLSRPIFSNNKLTSWFFFTLDTSLDVHRKQRNATNDNASLIACQIPNEACSANWSCKVLSVTVQYVGRKSRWKWVYYKTAYTASAHSFPFEQTRLRLALPVHIMQIKHPTNNRCYQQFSWFCQITHGHDFFFLCKLAEVTDTDRREICFQEQFQELVVLFKHNS